MHNNYVVPRFIRTYYIYCKFVSKKTNSMLLKKNKNKKLLRKVKCMFSVKEDVNNNNNNKTKKELCMIRTF